MNEHFSDIFYLKFHSFSPEKWEEICRDAFSKKYNWWIDHQPEWQRKQIDLPFDEIVKYLYTEKIHFSIIHRRGYENWNTENSWNKWHLEIGFCTLARKTKLPTTNIDIEGDLFLWIELDEKHIPYFIETYNLKEQI